MSLKTTELMVGDTVRLISFGDTDKAYIKQLVALGVTACHKARVTRRAPLGSPIQLDICGTSLMLRAEEAISLEWEHV